MTRVQRETRLNQCKPRGQERVDSPLQAPWRADANQPPHEEPELKPPV